MVMMVDSAPRLKSFIQRVAIKEATVCLIMRIVIAFINHSGRMSCSQASCVAKTERVHKSQISRFLARTRWRSVGINDKYRDILLKREASSKGRFFVIGDATSTTKQGKHTQNTSHFGNRKRRKQKKRRYARNKSAKKNCHTFTFALLITPSGARIPFQRPFYTKEYCKQHGIEHRSTAESLADLIDQLPLPPGADVVVLGDTAYDAKVVQDACARRNYIWIVPCNAERVLAGPKGARPKVRSLLDQWSKYRLQRVRFVPCRGKYAKYRRLSRYRIGPKMKPRTFYVHKEIRQVHSVGKVLLVFSTTEPELKKATPNEVKILMTNAIHLSISEVVELYSLRWQIEQFFKEIKSTLGFDHYKFKNFAAVEGWVELAITTVLYLEWYRTEQLQRRDLTKEEITWWKNQRLHGICQAVQVATEEADLKYVAERIKTKSGIKRLKRIIASVIAA